MKNTGYFFLPLICFIIGSCQKEIDNTVLTSGTGGSSGNTNGNLLIKLIGLLGSDSLITSYTYNSSKQLVATRSNTAAGSDSYVYNNFERNAAGLIVGRKQYTIIRSSPIPVDVSITTYHYSNDAAPQMTYSVSSSSTLGGIMSDSIVYVYNTVGKLIKTDSYLPNTATGTIQDKRRIFTYDTIGNMSKLEIYNLRTGIPVLLENCVYKYDNHIPSQSLTEEETIAIQSFPVAIHNLINYEVFYTLTSGSTSNIINFTYNSSGRPKTCQAILIQLGATIPSTITNYTFYYE